MATPLANYEALTSTPERYLGRMVILGGYLLKIDIRGSKAILTVLNAPLMIGDEPSGMEYTGGRFIVTVDQPFDSENYTRYRRVTIAGIFRGTQPNSSHQPLRSWPLIESREIYLWTEFEYDERRFYNNDYYFPRPFPFFRPPHNTNKK